VSARRVIVSGHAVDRLLERDPMVLTRDAVAHIFQNVQDAFREGRTSKRIPRWAVSEDRDRMRNRSIQTLRYAWNVGQTACYVLVWARADVDGKRSWIVVTTLGARPTEVAA
jgi:hypothetical protein